MDLLKRAAPYALRAIEKELAAAEKRRDRLSEARRLLPPGSSRARVTTANARWSSACEAVERLHLLRHELRAAIGVR